MKVDQISGRETDGIVIRYRPRPIERVLFSLFFGGSWRAFALIGLASICVGLTPGLEYWRWGSIAAGVSLLLSFAWVPFASSPRGWWVVLTASPAGLDLRGQGIETRISWGSIRCSRRRAGALVLELDAGGRLPLPLRAFGPGQAEAFEGFVHAATRGDSTAEVTTAGPVLMTVRSRLSFEDVVLANIERPLLFGAAAAGLLMIAVGPITTPLLVPLGLVVATFPVWLVALTLLLGGALRSTTAPYDLEVSLSGYRARAGSTDSWVSWKSFGSARWRASVLVLRFAQRGCCLISTRGFSPEQLATLRMVLSENHLLALPATPSSAHTH